MRLQVSCLHGNHNHELKNLFKGAAVIRLAFSKPGPFQEF
jgi:hypothetical protein